MDEILTGLTDQREHSATRITIYTHSDPELKENEHVLRPALSRPAPRPAAAAAGGYQLWAPRSPLDESPWWLRGAAPPAAVRPPPSAAAALPERQAALSRPEAVRLRGLDAAFGRLVAPQPPRRSGSLGVSEHSAFCRVVGPRQRRPGGLREAQARLAAAMCRQMLRAILPLCATYKKCAFALRRSRRAGALPEAGPGLARPWREGRARGVRLDAVTTPVTSKRGAAPASAGIAGMQTPRPTTGVSADNPHLKEHG
ncbi:LOW QUALITY PROTEIN: FANCD2 opposite strand protein [Spheniscus humboldti]